MRVVFQANRLTHYRVPLHELLRERLAAEGIQYELVVGTAPKTEREKGDEAYLPWSESLRERHVRIFGKDCVIAPTAHARGADLLILGQENKHLSNYWLQTRPLAKRVALFGHGRNFQARQPNGLLERWKAHWATRCDWWFAYTDATKQHVASLGFPADRITVFDNSIDTSALRTELEGITPEQSVECRRRLGLSGPTGIYVGSLYSDKRLEFLISSADLVRAALPDFELVILGDGQASSELRRLAAGRDWIKFTGPLFGKAKAEMMKVSDVFLMPGLVGLAVLDAGVAGLPLVTTAYPFHSPEIAYLKHETNGLIVDDWRSEQAYADAVVGLLRSDGRRREMSDNARRLASRYTIEVMAERFAEGVLHCLAQQPRKARS